MIEPFFLRALAAGIGLAIIAAPLGCLVVWNRMAYLGETVAQASLLGVALALALDVDKSWSVLAAASAVALLIHALGRQRLVPMDAVLGLVHNGGLAAGIIATTLLAGPGVDLLGFLFGDLLAVGTRDLGWIWGGGALLLLVLWRAWASLLRVAVHEELAAAEGVDRDRTRLLFLLLLALSVAVAMKVVGVLLAIAFLVVPAAAARPFASTPERMVVVAVAIAVAGVVAGLGLSLRWDTPAGPSIVLVMALAAALSLGLGAARRQT